MPVARNYPKQAITWAGTTYNAVKKYVSLKYLLQLPGDSRPSSFINSVISVPQS